MKKINLVIIATILCLGVSTGCAAQENDIPNTTSNGVQTSVQKSTTSSTEGISETDDAEYMAAYKKLLAYKSTNYEEITVKEFNQLLASDANLSELFEDYATVEGKIPEDDENYDFITVTLNASLDEVYCEMLNDEAGFECRVKRLEKTATPLNDEERSILEAEPIYDFQFFASCYVHYQVIDQALTVGERDVMLKSLRDGLQNYVDTLEEDEIINGDVKELLEKKAEELAGNLDKEKIVLDFDVQSISVAGDGIEVDK